MKIKTKDLQPNMMGIYKINFPNGKIYIGLSVDIKRRIQEHNTPSENKTPCDKAINIYGRITEIEILEFVNDKELLGEREKYWISFYHSNDKEIGYNLTNGGDMAGKTGEQSPKSIFTDAQVLDIRKRRFLGEQRKNVYKDYQNISLATFDNVWLGKGYANVGKEYLIPYNPEFNRKYFSSLANSGLNSAKSKCSKEEVLDIRKKRKEGMSYIEIPKLYPHISKSTVRRIALKEVYKDVE